MAARDPVGKIIYSGHKNVKGECQLNHVVASTLTFSFSCELPSDFRRLNAQ